MKVRHPNLNEPNVLDVDESAVDEYLAAGWVRVGAKPARAVSKPTNKPDAGDKE